MNNLFQKSNLKYIAFALIFYIASQNLGVFFGKSRAEKEIENQRISLISEVDSYSKKLPKKIDNITTQISIYYEESTKTLVYKNILTDYEDLQASNIKLSDFSTKFNKKIKYELCKDVLDKYQHALHKIEIKYFLASNRPVFNLNISISDCKNFPLE